MKPNRDALLLHLRHAERHTLLARRESTRLILENYERARALGDHSLEFIALTGIPLLAENLLDVLGELQSLQRFRDEICQGLYGLKIKVEDSYGAHPEEEE